ncbi:MAG: riboflavin biosynthesis protein RibF, partial [Duncaniella sp.]|nr:riboflavin biosynthesis protein RibF [Duncaniella sp.]
MNLITKQDTSARRIAAVGMYDGVHAGHRFLIDYLGVEARSRGLVPAVVTFSRHPLTVVRPLQAPALLNTLEQRVSLLGEAGAQDVILLSFNDALRRMSAREFLGALKRKFAIEALVLGFNNRFGHDRPDSMDQYKALGQEIGVEVITAPEYRGPGAPVSSSAIRRHLMEGRPEEAARLLGGNYTLRGKVINGKRLGRTLGFPTANLELPAA